ncbi:MAG: hypothetical protein M3P84_10305 [Chloroflexota bacterium]|nr:hypothetical protein [Chloroflexota bacterium]
MVFALSTGLAIWATRPWLVGAVGSDAASSVLYFDRLAAGVQLERFLGTTPKPFLTLVYGPLHAAFDDWRPISWLVVAVYGLGVAAAAVLAQRLSHSMAGGVFVAFALMASSGLLLDVSLAYTVSWSVLLWSIAGLAALADRPRYGVAGVALLIAGLIRPETLLICGLAGILLGARTIAARAGRGSAPARAAWLVLLGVLAIPVGALHDLLLTGDALYSLQVPDIGTGIRNDQSAGTAVRIVARHLTAFLPMLPLAGLGVVLLLQRRAWPALVGLTALGPGVAAFVLFLGSRQVFVLDRYALPIDLAVLLAASVGFGALAVPALAALLAGRSWVRAAGSATIAAALALALSPTVAPLDRTVITQIRNDQAAIADFGAARSSIAASLDALPGVRARPDRAEPLNPVAGGSVALLIPARLLSHAAVDLRLPLTRIARTDPSRLAPDGMYPAVGQLIYHDAHLDAPPAPFAFMEVGAPTTLGSVRIVPIHADAGRRVWVLRVDPR